MAKAKGKRPSTSKDAVSTGGDRVNGNADAAPSMPNLSDATLAKLTQSIEQRLKGKNEKPGPVSQKAAKAPAPSVNVENRRESRKESRPLANVKPTDKAGKKRDRSGKIISPQAKKETHVSGPNKKKSGNTLEEEIYAIGGTQDDYDLLAGVESNSEMEDDGDTAGGKNNFERLRRDLGMLIDGGDNAPTKSKKPVTKNTEPKAVKPQPQDAKPQSENVKTPGQKSKPIEKAPKKQDKKKSAKEEKVSAPDAPAPRKAVSSNLVMPPQPDWFSTTLPEIKSNHKETASIQRQVLDNFREYASSLLETENNKYATSRDSTSSSSHKFYSTIVSSGTLSDKISALTLAIQESPLHNVKALETLVGLARKRSRAQAVEVLRSLKDLFAQGSLLPSDRKLRSFASQPGLSASLMATGGFWSQDDPLPGGLETSHLISWAFEDFLKEQFFEVLKVLEVWCNDELEFSRSRAVSYVYELLKEKPEQESNLLRLIVNKLGDPSKKIASRASYLLLQLEQAHPLMKGTIISAIESESLFRPGQSQHAKYYSVITLNQTILSNGDDKLGAQLLNIYFGLFVSLLKTGKESNAPEEPKKIEEPKKGKANKNKGKKRRAIARGQGQEEELREKLISGVLTGVNRAYPFMTSSYELLSKHLETLFRITHSSNFNTSIQALMLIQQLSISHAVSAERFYRTLYESLLDPRIATSSKQSLYLNLLYKSLKSDMNIKRVKAFVKRLIQILGMHQPSFICGVLYLIRELESTFPALTALVDQPEDHDDDEEVFKDVPEDGEEDMVQDTQETKQQNTTGYDSRKRDPEQSNADKSCLWELVPYLSHFHPSVSVSARQLLLHEKLSGKPDLTIHTLTHFLDRFVYRSPKASPGLRGSSIMQPLAGGDTSGLLLASGKTAKSQGPVNSESFWKKRSEDVAAEDVFFHDYFNRLGKDKVRGTKTKKKTGAKDDSDEESDGEAEIWKALVESQPEVDGGHGSDSDDDLEGFESAMDDSDNDVDEMDEGADIDDVIFNDESSDQAEEEGEEEEPSHAEMEKGMDQDEDPFDLDLSDDEAFRGSDDDLPSDLDMGVDMDMDVEEEQEDEVENAKKKERLARKEKRRKLKHLPTFASFDDYAALLDKEDPDQGF